MKRPVYLIDTTLREGEQTVGVHFKPDQKKEIINRLALIGIAELEVGTASPLNRDLPEIIEFCRTRHPGLCISLWSRCKEEDIRFAATLGTDRISLSIPSSDLHLHRRLGKDRGWAERTMQDAIRIAGQAGMEVSIGFEDATRADPAFLARLAGLAEKEGAFRVRLADTVGLTTPIRLLSLIRTVGDSVTGCEIAIHAHNDFGMATANALTALEAGATWADVTVLGLGERSGCARLEEVAGFLALMHAESGLDPEHLKPLAEYVAVITGRRIERDRPLLGDGIFCCETGLHLQGLQQDPAVYEAYPPERIGAVRRLLFGSKCGRSALKTKIARLGYVLDDETLLRKTCAVRDKSLLYGRTLNDDEILLTVLSETGFGKEPPAGSADAPLR